MSIELAGMSGATAVADGGWSTILWTRGLSIEQPAERANLTAPDLVQTLARDYLDAGAIFLTTNTFGANRWNFARAGVDTSAAEVCGRGADIARQAVGDRNAVVAGSIGPSGKILAVQEVAEDELREEFTAIAEALVEGGADVLVLETFSELREILIALDAVKAATGRPVIASMSFDSGPQRARTMMGATAAECGKALDDAGADVIGCNCGATLPAVVALRAATQRPLWVRPNAGAPELVDGRPVWRRDPVAFVADVMPLIAAGANIVGGCCGAGPEHIAKLAAAVRRRGA
jgi:methionine synthase I (cobalamin-dependent)